MAYHQSEACFRRYESVIQKALEQYPESVRFKSDRRTASTDSARCTNAIAAYRRNRWPTASAVFDLIEDRALSVWIEKDYSVIGPAVNKDEIQLVQGVGGGLHGAIRCNPKTNEHVRAMLHLINDGVFQESLEMPKSWQVFVEQESAGMLNIAMRVESSTIILF